MMCKCLECGSEISASADLMVAEIIACPGCQSEFEVISIDPVQLMLAPEIEEDWGE